MSDVFLIRFLFESILSVEKLSIVSFQKHLAEA